MNISYIILNMNILQPCASEMLFSFCPKLEINTLWINAVF